MSAPTNRDELAKKNARRDLPSRKSWQQVKACVNSHDDPRDGSNRLTTPPNRPTLRP